MAWIHDPISSRLDREYRYAEERMAYNAERGNWDIAERWAQYASELCRSAQVVCWAEDEDRADV